MTEAERQSLISKAMGMTEEQAKVIVSAFPTWILWKEVECRITDLLDFKSKYDDLQKISDRIHSL